MTPPNDALIASWCGIIYKPTALIDFDHFDAGEDDGVCWAIKKFPGVDLVVFRGSVTALDWVRDLRSLAVRTRVGHVHIGFWAAMEHVWSDLRPLLTQPAIIAGHSLGAARASVMTALMVADGAAPIGRVVFGEPKPGMLDLAKIVETVPGRSYRNGDELHHDLITDVPFSFPPLQYMHPTPIIPVCCLPPPDEFERGGVFAWHHIELYQTALNNHVAQIPQEKAA
ncbi:Lipase (class 3) [Bradyrhizobium brasilense]|uniref:Lipase (Class 3) n=1 Tax=Bradyrhizobium brasilense TaxID=1419277 RepID=A0A1G6Z027_9BRAD|nr:lipase family protein [Bradyrhizobium brasilense]SDD95872.1 Lipase (class 3) [Bradyrhizobium brasilense]